MDNFFSSLFGGRVSSGNSVNPKCQAEDPNNCRICHTGKFSPAAKTEAAAENADTLTPAERELAKIKAKHANVGSSVSSVPVDSHVSSLRKVHKAKPKSSYSQVSHFGGIWEGSEYRPKPPPDPRTPDQIEEAIAKAKPSNLKAVRELGNYVDESGKKHDTRISPLTGRPISRELNAAIDALMCGVHVSDHEIESTPEWKEAERLNAEHAKERVKSGKGANTWSDTSDEREKIRKDVFAKITSPVVTHELNDALKKGETYDVEKGYRFDIVMGIPGSGKNYTFADRLSHENHSRLADADIIKRLLPGYDGGLGASDVHDESTFINRDLLDEAYKKGSKINGDNIVYQTMGSNSSLIDHIEKARAAGYKVNLHFCDIDVDQAKGRMLYRFMNTGRTIPLSVYGRAGTVASSYESAKPYADTAERVKASAGKGIEPKEVENVTNANPKTRPVSKPVNYSQYGLFGYSGGFASSSKQDKDDGVFIAQEIDDDIPSWLDDPAFWDDPVNYEDKYQPKPRAEQAKTPAPAKRSGLSIDDIIAGKGLRK